MAASVLDIINSAARKINILQVGETLQDDDANVALYQFSNMIDSWSNQRLLIYEIQSMIFNFTSGQQVYTLGPGGDWDTSIYGLARPIRIEDAYVIYANGANSQAVDLRIKPLNSSQWASIAVKSTTSTFATAYYDDGNFPLRNISFWPIPTSAQSIRLWTWQPLVDFTAANLTTLVEYPPGYVRAFEYNLAIALAAEWGKSIDESVVAIADSTLASIRSSNTVVPVSRIDSGIAAKNRTWNWITGDTVNVPGPYS